MFKSFAVYPYVPEPLFLLLEVEHPKIYETAMGTAMGTFGDSCVSVVLEGKFIAG